MFIGRIIYGGTVRFFRAFARRRRWLFARVGNVLVAVPTGKGYIAPDEAPCADFIGNLCVSLFHRWKAERIFVILTSYYDEAGTHGGSPVTVMAGVMATANQWRRFGTIAAKLKRNYDFSIFHTIDFKAKRGEFRGWSVQSVSRYLLSLVMRRTKRTLWKELCAY